MNKTQSGSEEYIPGDYNYDQTTEVTQVLEFANFPKCCPLDQVRLLFKNQS